MALTLSEIEHIYGSEGIQQLILEAQAREATAGGEYTAPANVDSIDIRVRKAQVSRPTINTPSGQQVPAAAVVGPSPTLAKSLAKGALEELDRQEQLKKEQEEQFALHDVVALSARVAYLERQIKKLSKEVSKP